MLETYVAYQKETSACPFSGGTLVWRRSGVRSRRMSKCLHIPWHDKQESALQNVQYHGNIPDLEHRLGMSCSRISSTKNPHTDRGRGRKNLFVAKAKHISTIIGSYNEALEECVPSEDRKQDQGGS